MLYLKKNQSVIYLLFSYQTGYIISCGTDFMTNICKKAAQHFHSAVSKVFDRVKSVTLWSANIRKLAKDHKGYGSTAR